MKKKAFTNLTSSVVYHIGLRAATSTQIIAVAIIVAGVLISNALSDGFTTLREAISYAGEISH